MYLKYYKKYLKNQILHCIIKNIFGTSIDNTETYIIF